MEKKVVVSFLVLCSLFILLTSVSAWSVEITKLNNHSITIYYNTKVSSFSYQLVNASSTNILKMWYSLDGGISLKDLALPQDGQELYLPLSELDWSKENWNSWIVFANSSEGELKNFTLNFWVDSIPPVLNYITPSLNLAYTNRDSFNFQFLLNETNKGSYQNITFTPFRLKFYGPYDSMDHLVMSDLVNLSSVDVSLSEIKNVDFSNKGNSYEGNYTWAVFAKDVYPNGTQIRVVNLTGIILRDTIPPRYFNELSQQDKTYSPNKSYNFSINWEDYGSGIESIWINFNGTNYTSNGIFSISDLAAGNYFYSWHANDSAGNINSTEVLNYTIEKALTQCYLMGSSVEYPNLVNISASCNHEQGALTLYRDHLDVSFENSLQISLPFGTYYYSVNMSETSNYTAASENKTILVSKGRSEIALIINSSSSNFSGEFPQNISIQASLINGIGVINLTLDGVTLSDSSSTYSAFHNLKKGYYNLTAYYAGNQNYTESFNILWINISDTTPPAVNLISPLDSSALNYNSNNVIFSFNSTDISGIENCSLFLNGLLNQSGNETNFTIFNLGSGSYNWAISCKDSEGNIGYSNIRQFTILTNLSHGNNFSEYTNLSNTSNISEVIYFFVNNTHGMINWTEKIDFSSGFDWTNFIELSPAKIFIDSIGQPLLNRSARLYFYNINLTRPEVLRDGLSFCSSLSCYNYSNETLILSLDVDSFFEYTIREYIAPIVYSSVGSGGSGCSYNSSFNWNCSEWSICDNGVQIRSCLNFNNCGSTFGRPETQRSCILQQAIAESEFEVLDSDLIANEENNQFQGLTGAVIGLGRARSYIITFIVILLLSVFLGLVVYKRNKDLRKARFLASLNSSLNSDSQESFDYS
jgi:hypothetical protein